ncbi:hypothetical protein GCM10009540_56010 [Streptomyces turgidiscabies]
MVLPGWTAIAAGVFVNLWAQIRYVLCPDRVHPEMHAALDTEAASGAELFRAAFAAAIGLEERRPRVQPRDHPSVQLRVRRRVHERVKAEGQDAGPAVLVLLTWYLPILLFFSFICRVRLRCWKESWIYRPPSPVSAMPHPSMAWTGPGGGVSTRYCISRAF